MAETSIKHDDGAEQTSVSVAIAVKEILQIMLSKCRRTGIQVSIKSTKPYHNSTSKSWFYIKVTSKYCIDRIQLEERSKTPALHSILEYMQSLEHESHLCIQNPCDMEDEGQSSLQVQQNLILEGERLNVLNEVKKSKKVEESSLYLRIHDSILHMMRECSHIHNNMSQIRVFRPKADIRFTMKIGEAISHTDFSIESRRKLSKSLPSIVTDAAFYLQDSEMRAVCDTVVPCVIDPVWTNVQIQTSENNYINRSINISTIALYIPVEHSLSSICVLTFYGPGCLPLDVSAPSPLLTNVDWSRFKLKVDSKNTPETYKGLLPHHARVCLQISEKGCDIGPFVIKVFVLLQFANKTDTSVDYQEMNRNMESLLTDLASILINVIQKIIDKLLQPVINNAKNRDVVMRSVSGICKAVTDIVSMSSNEKFRTATLNYMKVKDTVELGAEMKHKLTDISQRKHSSIWTDSYRKYSLSSEMGQESQNGSKGSLENWFKFGKTSDVVDRKAGKEQTVCHGDDANCDRPVEDQDDGNKISDINKDSTKDTDETLITCPNPFISTLNRNQSCMSNIDKQIGENLINRLESEEIVQNKTPEIQRTTDDMEEVSPFHQLVMEGHAACMDITPDLTMITQGMKDVSPFKLLNEDHNINTVHAEVGTEDPCQPILQQTVPDLQTKVMDVTPDVSQVIQGMKDVSPFQQFACDEQIVPTMPNINTEDPCLPQITHGEIQQFPMINQVTESICTIKGSNPVNSFSLKENTSLNSPNNHESTFLKSFHDDLLWSQATSDIHKLKTSVTDKHVSNLLKNHLQESEIDFELLNSEDFGAAIEVVSEFVNETKCKEEIKDINIPSNNKVEDCAYSNVSKENINLDNEGLDKPNHTDKQQDIDDWFNDVLLEVGEWFD